MHICIYVCIIYIYIFTYVHTYIYIYTYVYIGSLRRARGSQRAKRGDEASRVRPIPLLTLIC